MKKFILLTVILINASILAQDTLNHDRWNHEFQVNGYSMTFLYGGQELDFQTSFKISESTKVGARVGFFYHQQKAFNYQMVPIFLTTETFFENNEKITFCADLGTPLLLNEDSKRIDNFFRFWASSSYSPSEYDFRKRIILISQFSLKFNVYKGIRATIGLNNYWGSSIGTPGSWFVTVGLKAGVAYQF